MQTLNPDHIKALLDLINHGPYIKLLSMRISDMGKSFATVEIDMAGFTLR